MASRAGENYGWKNRSPSKPTPIRLERLLEGAALCIYQFECRRPHRTTKIELLSTRNKNTQMKKIYLSLLLLTTLYNAHAISGLVISQIYGGGGNAGSIYTNDFIEIFNRSSSAIS